MRFEAYRSAGLIVLANARRARSSGDEPVPIARPQAEEAGRIFQRLNRKRRALLGSMVANMIGEDSPRATISSSRQHAATGDSRRVTAATRRKPSRTRSKNPASSAASPSRVKKTADSYLNQKLDEIEARIDRKLDEIDRRLAEWRDKEIANRIRILKITLWVSVIVGVFSLIYSYVQVYFSR